MKIPMAKQHSGRKARTPTKPMPFFIVKRLSEGSFILTLTGALFVLLSLLTYQSTDPGWSHTSNVSGAVANLGGQVGAYIADGLYFIFGYFAYLLPLTVVYLAWAILHDLYALKALDKHVLLLRSAGLVLMIVGGCGLLHFETQMNQLDAMHGAGGLIGQLVGAGWYHMLNLYGASLVLLAMFLVGTTWLTGLSWLKAIELLGCYTLSFGNKAYHFLQRMTQLGATSIERYKAREPVMLAKEMQEKSAPKLFRAPAEKEKVALPLLIAHEVKPNSVKPIIAKEIKEIRTPKVSPSGSLPALELLDKGLPGKPMGGYTHSELENLSRDLEQHLLDFGIQADVVAVHPGPVVTRFELQLAAGIKVSKLSALAKDLARSMSVISVRVVEVIPGKTVVGLELPNQSREMVRLSDVLSADVYQQAHSALTLAMGVDIAGHPVVVDLAKMPHLLVAGTTGSGKSVGINAMILSILFKATPEQVRLIMIDPKMLELSVYDGIPHLLTPVVTDMKEAASALRWCVEEMERRYKLMASLGVRNLAGYNAKVAEAIAAGVPLTNPLWKPTDSMDATAPELHSLPHVVVVIDELADMMMVVKK
jgi:DNA segregation ATPase FtsK/SpoIIIE, S-DNA-T family